MNRIIAFVGLLMLACGSAHAQTYPFPNAPYAGEKGTGAPSTSDQILVQQGVTSHDPVGSPARMTLGTLQGLIGGLPLSGGTLTGALTAPGVNTTAATGYQVNGVTVLNSGTALNSSTLVGKNAGASNLLSNPWLTAVGSNAAQYYNASGEVTATGNDACWQLTVGSGVLCAGQHAGGSETTTGMFTAVGGDDMRNTIGCLNCTSTGAWANRNGVGSRNTVAGTKALEGNGSAVTLGGTPTVGDVVTLNFTTTASGMIKFPASTSYTVQAGDTLASIASTFATQINVIGMAGPLTGVQAWVADADAPGGPATIALDFPGNNTVGYAISVAYTLSGGATETVTIGTGFSGQYNDVSGYEALNGLGITSAANLSVHGALGMPFAVSAINGVCDGAYCGYLTQSSSKFVMVGSHAGYNWNGAYGATYLGDSAGYGSTTGFGNTIVGAEDAQGAGGSAQNCITTGNFNVELGMDACVPFPTAPGQLSIQNIIFGTGNNALGSGAVSSGMIGVGTRTPNAKLEVNGGVRLNTATTQPACDVTQRGTEWFVQGAAGAKDALSVCAKDATDAYAWRTLY